MEFSIITGTPFLLAHSHRALHNCLIFLFFLRRISHPLLSYCWLCHLSWLCPDVVSKVLSLCEGFTISFYIKSVLNFSLLLLFYVIFWTCTSESDLKKKYVVCHFTKIMKQYFSLIPYTCLSESPLLGMFSLASCLHCFPHFSLLRIFRAYMNKHNDNFFSDNIQLWLGGKKEHIGMVMGNKTEQSIH